jgi:tetratricopeptide (TPR) repeat protein
MANTYARAGDDRGLRDFYQDRLKALRDAPPAVVAGLRRGLILALDRRQDYAGAVDQYIEIVNRFPEDEALVQEAALHAIRNQRQQQLRAYYTKAATDSPRDLRWPMVLARLETHFEDYPGAIAAYGRATGIRPDRTDLHAARAALEERLMRFDDAARSYAQLYDLTYQTPHWMEKVAEVRARQRQSDAAVAALRRALIEGRPERPEIFFETARRLDSWNLLPQARGFAERGVELAGKELLVDQVSGAQVYARIMTRLRAYEEAYARLTKAPLGDGLVSALRSLGETVARQYSPQEQAAFAAFLEKQKTPATTEILLALAQSSGLGELEVRWRYEILMAAPGTPQSQVQYQPLVGLQRQRMRFEELGGQLEAYWKALPKTGAEAMVLDQAAESYRAAGDDEAESRVLATRYQHYGLSGDPRDRFFGLLLARDPQRLVALAAGDYAAAEFAIARGDATLARQAVAARGRALPAVWTRAYTALAGVHQAEPRPGGQCRLSRSAGNRNHRGADRKAGQPRRADRRQHVVLFRLALRGVSRCAEARRF